MNDSYKSTINRLGWEGFILILPILILAIVATMLATALTSESSSWEHIVDFLLVDAFTNTIWLVIGNWVVTLPIGVGLAWLVCRYDFHGRYWFERLFIVPIAIPPYVLAFILVDIFDFTGNINQQLADLGIVFKVNAHSVFFVILSMSLVCFPYCYLLVRASFQQLQTSQLERAKLLGLSEWQIFWRIAIPLTLPAIFAAAALIGMESMADFGVVSTLNYDTLSTLIYKSWLGLFDPQAATRVALILLAVVLANGLIYAYLKSHRKHFNPHQNQLNRLQRVPLFGLVNGLACGVCSAILLFSFVLPVMALCYLALLQANWAVAIVEAIQPLLKTILLGVVSAMLIVVVSLFLVSNHFFSVLQNDVQGHQKQTLFNGFFNGVFNKSVHLKIKSLLYELTSIGYAMPAIVLAIALYLLAIWLTGVADQLGWSVNITAILNHTIIGILMLYLIRFLAVSHKTLSSAIFRISPSMLDSVKVFKVHRLKMLSSVFGHLLRLPILSALILVFVEVIKEMPGTLMLRPLGWDTLAVKIFGYTQEAQWSQAAIPSLMLLMLNFLAVFVILAHDSSHR